jgi:hypothetical protein
MKGLVYVCGVDHGGRGGGLAGGHGPPKMTRKKNKI